MSQQVQGSQISSGVPLADKGAVRGATFCALQQRPGLLKAGSRALSAEAVRVAGQGKRNIPNPMVTDQTGKTYHFYDDLVKDKMVDKMVVINFYYANCTGTCPVRPERLGLL